jgi:hypothetical protein
VNFPTLVLSIESSSNYIKYPYNYANDVQNEVVRSTDWAWFYSAIDRDFDNYNQSIAVGNYLSHFRTTNNGDNDDYFRGIKNTMAYTWSIGHQDHESLLLNQTNSSIISKILTANIDLGLYAIQKSGEQIKATVNHFDV